MNRAPVFRHHLDRFNKKVDAIASVFVGRSLPLDPRINSIHWLFDCQELCKQIEFSVSKMREFGKAYRRRIRPGQEPSHVDPRVTYYADNVVIRLLAIRDKLALCIWAYFCPFRPFDPFARLDLKHVLGYLERPAEHRVPPAAASRAREVLLPLEGLPSSLRQYRNMKIHGREPRIELHGVRPHHDWPYVVPVETAEDEKAYEAQLAKRYDEDEIRFFNRTSRIRGTVFRRLSMEENARLVSYTALDKACLEYRTTCYAACDQVASFLRRRSPFRRRRK